MKLIIINKELFNNRKLLDKELKESWLNALKSGRYNKGTGYLCKNDKYCCLGVLCEVLEADKREHKDSVHYFSFDKKGFKKKIESSFSFLPFTTEGLDERGTFIGFNLEIYDKLHDYRNYDSLVELNDYTDTFDSVIKVIEEYF